MMLPMMSITINDISIAQTTNDLSVIFGRLMNSSIPAGMHRTMIVPVDQADPVAQRILCKQIGIRWGRMSLIHIFQFDVQTTGQHNAKDLHHTNAGSNGGQDVQVVTQFISKFVNAALRYYKHKQIL